MESALGGFEKEELLRVKAGHITAGDPPEQDPNAQEAPHPFPGIQVRRSNQSDQA